MTDAQIEALKRQHGFLVIVDVVQGGTTYNAIFKEPTFAILEATGSIGKNNKSKQELRFMKIVFWRWIKKLKP
ncbi:hypothetical protein E5F92_009190 [Flavobacterium columnare]|uniref:hypothetical protein n=1 Tax=Flavobacterium columnare TaxID=996 RepID=UPI002989F543|nr:hypothetical protein [Flavobacterium columnare]MCH4832839.1 hypothetical protein [Flavobacterium columnare]